MHGTLAGVLQIIVKAYSILVITRINLHRRQYHVGSTRPFDLLKPRHHVGDSAIVGGGRENPLD